ncbi:CHAT domain-containing protein [Aspergillus pseudoustus]|uniref:CHAT domain-containing protein n=1 Tax=Aspergillus pseudoustus TaxID=1810923 RepID=A0ABR4JSW4_9EURO
MDVAYWDREIDEARQTLATLSCEDADYAPTLHVLGSALNMRSRLTGDAAEADEAFGIMSRATEAASNVNLEDLQRVIRSQQDAVEAMSPDDDKRAFTFNAIGVRLQNGYSVTGEINYINDAIKYGQLAVATERNEYDRFVYLRNLAFWLDARYNELQAADDLQLAIEAAEAASKTAMIDSLDRAESLNDLGIWLFQRFQLTDDEEDLRRAIECGKLSIETTPGDDYSRPARLGNLLIWLDHMYDRSQEADVLTRVISIGKEHLCCIPEDDPDRAFRLDNLAVFHERLFQRTRDPADLDQAIEFGRAAISTCGDDSPQCSYACHLGVFLGLRFGLSNASGDINSAIQLLTDNVDRSEDGWECTYFLIKLLWNRFDIVGALEDLDTAITLAMRIVEAEPAKHEDHSKYLSIFLRMLVARFESHKDTDLDEGINGLNMVLDRHGSSLDHSERLELSVVLGMALEKRFEKTKRLVDLDKAISTYVKITEAASHTESAMHLLVLSQWFETRFDHANNVQDLNEAIEAASRAVRLELPDDERAGILNQLGTCLVRKFEFSWSTDSLDQAIDAAENAVKLASVGSATWAAYCNNLATYLRARSEQTGYLDDCENAITIISQVMETLPNHPDLFTFQRTLASLLYHQYKQSGMKESLDNAIEVLRLAFKIVPVTHAERAATLITLGTALAARFNHTGEAENLAESVEVSRAALEGHHGNDTQKSTILNSLALRLSTLFEQTGNIENLTESIQLSELSVEATPDGHISQPTRLNTLAGLLIRHYDLRADIKDLDSAVRLMERAQGITPHDHPDQVNWLTALGEALSRRFERTGRSEDLDRAVDSADTVVKYLARTNPLWHTSLMALAHRLGMRFKHSGDIRDLHQRMAAASTAMDATPVDHIDRLMVVSGYSNALEQRYDRLGVREDLDRCIELSQHTVDMVASDHIDRPMYLTQLAGKLTVRFKDIGLREDIDRAIVISRMAVELTPVHHADYLRRMSNLASALSALFIRTANIKTLQESIGVLTAVLETYKGYETSVIQMKLATMLLQRYQLLQQEADLDRAILLCEDALPHVPTDDSNRAPALNNLAQGLQCRFMKSGSREDWEKVLRIFAMCAEETAPGHLHKATHLQNSGVVLLQQYERTGDLSDFNNCVKVFKDGLGCDNGLPWVRIRCAKWLGILLATAKAWQDSVMFFSKALSFLPMLSTLSLSHRDKQSMLSGLSGLSGMAASATLNAGEGALKALELLELGRGVIAGLVLNVRTDVSKLIERLPSLAKQFLTIRDALDTPESDATSLLAPSESFIWELRGKQRREKESEFHDICEMIRSQPGFENFLRAPTAQQMMAATKRGDIIVLNVSPIRSDAFLITSRGVEVVNLPNLAFDQAQEIARKLRRPHLYGNQELVWILEWGWEVIARPCLEGLGHRHHRSDSDGATDSLPRVWWVLTGPLSHFPIHAAGKHHSGLQETVMDWVISSYSSSIKALLHVGPIPEPPEIFKSAPARALLVPMQDTPGQKPLPFANVEVRMLEGLCKRLQLDPIPLPQIAKKDVLAALKTCPQIFHFAGHGSSNGSDPSRSCLLLEDWQSNPLSVTDLRDNWLLEDNKIEGRAAPFLAYLSACSTGSNRDDNLIDEAIHLVSSCQLAGFRHVIGTLWAVSDQHCVDIAREFYETLIGEGMTDHAVAKGLHRAIRHLRDLDVAAQDQEVETRRTKTKKSTATKGLRQMRLSHGRDCPPNPLLVAVTSTTRSSIPASQSQHPPGVKTETASAPVPMLDAASDPNSCRQGTNLLHLEQDRQSVLPLGSNSLFPHGAGFAAVHVHDTRELEPELELDIYTLERDASLCDSDDEDDEEKIPPLRPLLWAPYFHVGV